MRDYMRSTASAAIWTESRMSAQPLGADHPVALANADLRAELLASQAGIPHAEMGVFATKVQPALSCATCL